MKTICVLGMGYVGMPTACLFAANGYQVQGVDIDEARIKTIQSGATPIKEPGLKTLLSAALHSGNLSLMTRPQPADVFIMAVPTPTRPDHSMDAGALEQAAESIYPLLKPGNLVIVESTVTPGTTENVVQPILAKSGLELGTEVYLAYCPERVLSGDILKELIDNDRLIGGLNEASALQAKQLYEGFIGGEICLTNLKTAELTKVVENTYRDVNIAFANELAQVCAVLGINVMEVIRFANRHPRVHILTPGPGVGGHCISVDPWFLVELAPQKTHLIQAARARNDAMPHFVAAQAAQLVAHLADPKIAIFGATFKGNVDDVRNSPALAVCQQLKQQGITFQIYEPYARDFAFELVPLETAITGSDLILLLADHREFHYLSPEAISQQMRTPQIYDTRYALSQDRWESAGFRYCHI